MKTITIVGIGALGSHVAMFLRSLDVELRLIDFDKVEQKNVASQFHGKTHLGRLKVDSVKQTFNLLWGRKVATFNFKVESSNIDALLSYGESRDHLVIDCLDNGKSRRLVQEHVRAKKIPCLHGALAADGVFGRVIWDRDFVVDDEANAGQATCEGGEHLPFIAIVSAYIAKAAQEWSASGKQIGFSISAAGAMRI